MKITIHQARDFEPQKGSCSDCGQGIHQVSEFCPCCGLILWAHDTLLSAWTCAGMRSWGREFATHVRPDTSLCTRCGRLAGTPTAPCGACPDYMGRACPDYVSMALAEHTAPALDVIEQAARQGHAGEMLHAGEKCDLPHSCPICTPESDPFAGIPNAGDEENRSM